MSYRTAIYNPPNCTLQHDGGGGGGGWQTQLVCSSREYRPTFSGLCCYDASS